MHGSDSAPLSTRSRTTTAWSASARGSSGGTRAITPRSLCLCVCVCHAPSCSSAMSVTSKKTYVTAAEKKKTNKPPGLGSMGWRASSCSPSSRTSSPSSACPSPTPQVPDQLLFPRSA
eukprot:1993523-Rhodomonas_salina.1